MDPDREIDAELRELFTSDRLDVAVRPDAENIIVAGARRIRRRRIATATASGVVAVVATVVAGIAMATGDPDAMPPATTQPSVPPQTSVTSVSSSAALPPAVEPPGTTGTSTLSSTTTKKTTPTVTSDPGPPDLNFQVIGPTGFRGLELAQSLAEAQATGLLGEATQEPGGGCTVYELLTDDRASGRVYVNDTVQVIAPDPVQTPEGVGAGWTIAQAKAVYPIIDEKVAEEYGNYYVPVPGVAYASYRLEFADGLVTRVLLQAVPQICYQ